MPRKPCENYARGWNEAIKAAALLVGDPTLAERVKQLAVKVYVKSRLTVDQTIEAERLYMSGLSTDTVARMLRITDGQVEYIVRKMGLRRAPLPPSPHRRRLPQQGMQS
jgi:uncharacterized membrane protein YebE (DUF533 family)